QQVPNWILVFDHQRAARGHGRQRPLAQVTRYGLVGRQREAKCRTGGGLAKRQCAAVRYRDTVRNRQTEPGALADLLRREKRLEDASAQGVRDSRSVIRNLDDVLAVKPQRADGDRPAPGAIVDRLLRVEQQVQDDLLNLLAIDED